MSDLHSNGGASLIEGACGGSDGAESIASIYTDSGHEASTPTSSDHPADHATPSLSSLISSTSHMNIQTTQTTIAHDGDAGAIGCASAHGDSGYGSDMSTRTDRTHVSQIAASESGTIASESGRSDMYTSSEKTYTGTNGTTHECPACQNEDMTNCSLCKQGKVDMIQIFFKNIQGVTKTAEINRDATITELQEAIERKEGIPGEQQRLIYEGHQLETERLSTDGRTRMRARITDYGIRSESTVHLTARLRGGGRSGMFI